MGKNKNITKIQCLDCKNLFNAEKGKELSVFCPICDSQNLRFIIGDFQDGGTLRMVRVEKVMR